MKEENIEIGKDMTPILLEDLGMRYPTEKSKKKVRYGLYQCQYCGKEWETKISKLKCCGCQRGVSGKENLQYKHGLSKHPLRSAWKGMHQRCYNINNPKYKNYGARGIIVCEEWKDNLLNFYNWAIDNGWKENSGLSLDRIDVNGNYEPDNCRWVTLNIQMQNTQNIRVNNKSGFRGVCYINRAKKWIAEIRVNKVHTTIGYFDNPLEAGKAYERYVRLNNLEHNFTPALTEEEIALL